MSAHRLLLVCGAAEDSELWEAVVAAAPCPTEVIELPPLDDPATLADHVAPHVQPADVVVGHSLGGAVAAVLAARGAHAAGWVLAACGSTLPVHRSVWERLEAEGPAAVAPHLARAAGGGARTERMFARNGAMLAAHLTACARFRAEARALANVEVLCGARDRMVDPLLIRDLASLTGARLTVLDDAAHQLPWETPEAVLAAAARVAPH